MAALVGDVTVIQAAILGNSRVANGKRDGGSVTKTRYKRGMKDKTSVTKSAKKKTAATSKVTAILKLPKKPLTEAFHVEEDPGARGTHGSPGRGEIRKTTHRVMGSRQSQRPLERSNQPRKKRG